MSRLRKSWPPIIARAAELVDLSPTGVTLRQVFYMLVSEGLIRNVESDYKKLSRLTARSRREGSFPALIDMTRTIDRLATSGSPEDALAEIAEDYRRDPLEGQDVLPVIVVEKATLVTQMWENFRDLGVPVTALRGYASETLETQMIELVEEEERDVQLLYCGDFDPTGEDIPRAFEDNTELELRRIALTPEQVEAYELPPAPGKTTDTRAPGFEARHGRLVQVELEALPPDALRSIVENEIDALIDHDQVAAVREREEDERVRLQRFADSWGD
jgi:hypothetical protein